MVAIPENVMAKVNDPQTVKVLVTSCDCGQPHAIVCGTIMAPQADKMIVGEVLMKKSAENLKKNPKAAFMVVAGMESYEIDVENPVRIAEGEILDQMNKNLEAIHLHANAVWMFDVKAVYDQGANPKAGTKIA